MPGLLAGGVRPLPPSKESDLSKNSTSFSHYPLLCPVGAYAWLAALEDTFLLPRLFSFGSIDMLVARNEGNILSSRLTFLWSTLMLHESVVDVLSRSQRRLSCIAKMCF